MKQHERSSHSQPLKSSRRAFLGWTGKLAAGSALMNAAMPLAHAGENNTIKIALVGCGGRDGEVSAGLAGSGFGYGLAAAMGPPEDDPGGRKQDQQDQEDPANSRHQGLAQDDPTD